MSLIGRFVARIANVVGYQRNKDSGNSVTKPKPHYVTGWDVWMPGSVRPYSIDNCADERVDKFMQELRDVEGIQADSLGPPTKVTIYTNSNVYSIQFNTRAEAQDLVRQIIHDPEPQVLNGEGWVLNLGEPVEFAYIWSEEDKNVIITRTRQGWADTPPGPPNPPRPNRPREVG